MTLDDRVRNISLEQPNEGLYVNGVWRWTERDTKGTITYCRYATRVEVMWWMTLCAMEKQIEASPRLYTDEEKANMKHDYTDEEKADMKYYSQMMS